MGAPRVGCMTASLTRWPWWRRALSFAGTLVAFVVVGFAGLAFALMGYSVDKSVEDQAFRSFGVFAAFASGISMFWRMKHPVRVLSLTSVLSIIFPLDPIGPAISLSWVVAKRPKSDLYWAIPLAAVAMAVSFVRDYFALTSETVMASGPEGGPMLPMSGLGYMIVWLVMLTLALAAGYVRRSRGQAAQAENVAEEKAQRVAQLEGELTRQEERDLIAREMHDTVAHHLSIVSLHAGALEVTSEDPEVPSSAKAMRESAHQALEEMRTLIHSLRDSESGGYAQAAPTLQALPTLVEDARLAGADISATFSFPSPTSPAVPPALARAVYRIVQEALTNALKHAPGSPITILVGVNEGEEKDGGATIEVLNLLPEGHEALSSRFAPASSGAAASDPLRMLSQTGGGAGLVGMRERAQALGGQLSAGAEEGRWVVHAFLPWPNS